MHGLRFPFVVFSVSMAFLVFVLFLMFSEFQVLMFISFCAPKSAQCSILFVTFPSGCSVCTVPSCSSSRDY